MPKQDCIEEKCDTLVSQMDAEFANLEKVVMTAFRILQGLEETEKYC